MIKDGNVTYTNQFVPCPRYQIEQELGEEYFPTIGEYKGVVGLLKLSFHSALVKQKIQDLKQVAPPNTNILMWNNKFYCLHEANLPMECRMFPDGRLEYLGSEISSVSSSGERWWGWSHLSQLQRRWAGERELVLMYAKVELVDMLLEAINWHLLPRLSLLS